MRQQCSISQTRFQVAQRILFFLCALAVVSCAQNQPVRSSNATDATTREHRPTSQPRTETAHNPAISAADPSDEQSETLPPGIEQPDVVPAEPATTARATTGDRFPQQTKSNESESVEPEETHQTSESPVTTEPQQQKILQPFPFITVHLDTREIEIEAEVCLDGGWLEQVMCTPGTREHEALCVTGAVPSQVHAALLMAGYKSGHPGRWEYEDREVTVIPPTGDALDVLVIYERNGQTVTEPVKNWIRDHKGIHDFPSVPWVFAGSIVAERPAYLGEGEYYVADQSGSVIGLVTFGDECLGWGEVLSDQAEIQPPAWEVNTDAIPPVGTQVTILLRPHGAE